MKSTCSPRLQALAVNVINDTNWLWPVEVASVMFVWQDQSATPPVDIWIQTTFELYGVTL